MHFQSGLAWNLKYLRTNQISKYLVEKYLRLLVASLFLFWELPQNIVGAITFFNLKRLRKVKAVSYEKDRFFIETPHRGVSLGTFIFWTKRSNRYSHLKNDCKMHEYGHSIQSRLLGPLYLLIVGIPSIMRFFYSAWYVKRKGSDWQNYYAGFPENWADKLGGVKS